MSKQPLGEQTSSEKASSEHAPNEQTPNEQAPSELKPLSLPLHGKHLIEASAGTGKTFNITRLYLRLLVEKSLSVQEILVMTFTEAATEEIRGRVAAFIDEVLENWDHDDAFITHLKQANLTSNNDSDCTSKSNGNSKSNSKNDADAPNIAQEEHHSLTANALTASAHKARVLLESAKLSIDEAAIFTIHGFCQRVIKQFASSMQENPDAVILPHTKERMLQAIADCIIAQNKYTQDFALLQEQKWHIPDSFYRAFMSALHNELEPQVLTPAEVWQEYVQTANSHWSNSASIREMLCEALSDAESWLLGLKLSSSNSGKIAKERQSAIGFLKRIVLIDEAESQRLFNLNSESHFSLNLSKDLFDSGLTTLFGGTRSKKYDEAWFSPLFSQFNELIQPIKQPLQLSSRSLNVQIRKCLAYQVVAKMIKKVKANMAESMNTDSLRSYDDLIRIVYENVVPSSGLGQNEHSQPKHNQSKHNQSKHNQSKHNQSKHSEHKRADLIRTQLLKQFPVALIDEFQDTDHQQYAIFNRLYEDSENNALIMIGDPKQAIYGFRGGDVFTYLKARQDADYVWTMDTNWRSTPAMISAYNYLFSQGSQSVFDYGIEYLPIKAPSPAQKQGSSLMFNIAKASPSVSPSVSASVSSSMPPNMPTNIAAVDCGDTALQFVCADAFVIDDESMTHIDDQKQQILTWMVNEIKHLLTHGVVEEQGDNTVTQHPIQAKDIAILVRAGHEAQLVKQALQAHGLASVYLSEKSPLFESVQAQNLYNVLDAVWTGNDQRRCISALATGIFYVDSRQEQVNNSDVITALIKNHSHPEWQAVYKQNAKYREIWTRDGIYALVMHLITASFDIDSEGVNTERALTNYQHLAELLAKAAVMHTTERAQLMYLATQLSHTQQDDTSQLRLESDQALIKVVTQHKSKGLEYPIVFLPFANVAREFKPGHVLKFHKRAKAAEPYQLLLQLGQSDAAKTAMQQEDLAEDMRLLYVALTRPIYRAYLGMTLTKQSCNSAVHRALGLDDVYASSFANNNTHSFADSAANTPANSPENAIENSSANNIEQCDVPCAQQDASSVLVQAIENATARNKHILVRRAKDIHEVQMNQEESEPRTLQIQSIKRYITQRWSLTSFTGIARLMQSSIKDTRQSSYLVDDSPISDARDAEENPLNTNNEVLVTSPVNKPSDKDSSSDLRFSLARGADAGNMLHDTFEWLSFDTPDFTSVAESLAMRHKLFTSMGPSESHSLKKEPLDELNTAHSDDAFSQTQQQYFAWISDCLAAPLQAPLQAALKAPSKVEDKSDLAPLLAPLCLNKLTDSSLIKEAEFYLPIDDLACAELRRLLHSHRQRIASQYGFDAIETKAINKSTIAGILHGFIDLIFEWHGVFYVCDYKSNHIGNDYAEYSKEQVAQDIQSHDYDLQYLLYSMALDRYLKQSMLDYDTKQHFGGVYYLYLRGMTAASQYLQDGQSPGVFYTEIIEAELAELQRLFGQSYQHEVGI